jgi:hypothetical protein
MSGIEPIILASLAGIGEAAAGVGTAIGSAASSVGSAVGIGSAASAGEAALIASAAEAAGVAAPGAAGITAGEALAGASALSSIAGAGAQLLSEAPKFDMPGTPTRDTAKQEADARAMQLKRRGRAATLLTGAQGVTSNPTLGSPALTGTA